MIKIFKMTREERAEYLHNKSLEWMVLGMMFILCALVILFIDMVKAGRHF